MKDGAVILKILSVQNFILLKKFIMIKTAFYRVRICEYELKTTPFIVEWFSFRKKACWAHWKAFRFGPYQGSTNKQLEDLKAPTFTSPDWNLHSSKSYLKVCFDAVHLPWNQPLVVLAGIVLMIFVFNDIVIC